MATVHLIYGFVGAGKTTYAKKLETESRAVRFSPDEWMACLYGVNPPRQHFTDYLGNIDAIIRMISLKLLGMEIDVIWDYGFWSRSSRDDARLWVKRAGANYKLHYVTCPEKIMRERVLSRSDALPDGALFINAAAIDEFKIQFEPPGVDEVFTLIETV